MITTPTGFTPTTIRQQSPVKLIINRHTGELESREVMLSEEPDTVATRLFRILRHRLTEDTENEPAEVELVPQQ